MTDNRGDIVLDDQSGVTLYESQPIQEIEELTPYSLAVLNWFVTKLTYEMDFAERPVEVTVARGEESVVQRYPSEHANAAAHVMFDSISQGLAVPEGHIFGQDNTESPTVRDMWKRFRSVYTQVYNQHIGKDRKGDGEPVTSSSALFLALAVQMERASDIQFDKTQVMFTEVMLDNISDIQLDYRDLQARIIAGQTSLQRLHRTVKSNTEAIQKAQSSIISLTPIATMQKNIDDAKRQIREIENGLKSDGALEQRYIRRIAKYNEAVEVERSTILPVVLTHLNVLATAKPAHIELYLREAPQALVRFVDLLILDYISETNLFNTSRLFGNPFTEDLLADAFVNRIGIGESSYIDDYITALINRYQIQLDGDESQRQVALPINRRLMLQQHGSRKYRTCTMNGPNMRFWIRTLGLLEGNIRSSLGVAELNPLREKQLGIYKQIIECM